MHTRREFLASVAVGAGAYALGASRLDAGAARAFPGSIGLQLWSLRETLPKDLPGTLAKVAGWGLTEVEGAGLWKHTAAELRAALDTAGLRCASAHVGFERLRDDLAGALAEARALGASAVVCPWIPHEKAFTRDDAQRAAEAFNRFGRAAGEAGLTFGYHCHGYEFVESPEGTLFDTLTGLSDAKLVRLQIDTFHAFHAGADPAALIAKHKDRVMSLHLKDEKKGYAREAGSPGAPPEADVPLGTGQVDFPAVLRAAVAAGVSAFYVEDESTDPLGHIPQSLAYLKALQL